MIKKDRPLKPFGQISFCVIESYPKTHKPTLSIICEISTAILERVKGIEPSSQAWEAYALPLSYTRNDWESSITKFSFQVICFSNNLDLPQRLLIFG